MVCQDRPKKEAHHPREHHGSAAGDHRACACGEGGQKVGGGAADPIRGQDCGCACDQAPPRPSGPEGTSF